MPPRASEPPRALRSGRSPLLRVACLVEYSGVNRTPKNSGSVTPRESPNMDQYGGSDPRGNPKAGHYRSQSSTPSKSPAKSAAKSATQWEDDSESEYSSDYDSGSSYASGAKATLPTRALCSEHELRATRATVPSKQRVRPAAQSSDPCHHARTPRTGFAARRLGIFLRLRNRDTDGDGFAVLAREQLHGLHRRRWR